MGNKGIVGFDYTWGSTTYQVEVGDGYLRVHEGGDCLFVAELQETPSDKVLRALIKTYYIGRQEGEGRGRVMLQHQLRELLGAAVAKP